MSLTKQDYELIAILEQTPSSEVWHQRETLQSCGPLQAEKVAWSRILTAARRHHIAVEPWLAALGQVAAHGAGKGYAQPTTATTLLAKTFPPLRCFVEEVLAEGLTILAGKP